MVKKPTYEQLELEKKAFKSYINTFYILPQKGLQRIANFWM
jgi:hypothetical protein